MADRKAERMKKMAARKEKRLANMSEEQKLIFAEMKRERFSVKATRLLDTLDAKDFKFECGKTYKFSWVFSKDSSDPTVDKSALKTGEFDLTLDDKCAGKQQVGGAPKSLKDKMKDKMKIWRRYRGRRGRGGV